MRAIVNKGFDQDRAHNVKTIHRAVLEQIWYREHVLLGVTILDNCRRENSCDNCVFLVSFLDRQTVEPPALASAERQPGGAMRKKIEHLTYVKMLADKNIKYKRKWVDCFPMDIPHISELPKDVCHRL
ncbi:hypothetical protein OBBRIDRAFT_808863 [Obba rivulosa]|uniref:Uncharacterized protein n=1 Tax=Obba rivulosa TaxID=1052685 RepID=A0A8E2AFP6_9APHY|nr:hypothetical protein OBBRIDRAFT_808863 [Obba rivulosa]